MKLKNWIGCSLVAAWTAAAGTVPASPSRGPLGCFPVRLTVQTNADEITLRLSGTVPDVNYAVMMRSNKPYSHWSPFTYVIGTTNGEPAPVRIGLKSGEAEGALPQGLRHIPAQVLRQMQFTAGSGEDADGDELPDLYEDLVLRTDPLNPDTANVGLSDGYQDADGDGWCNLQECQSGTDPLVSSFKRPGCARRISYYQSEQHSQGEPGCGWSAGRFPAAYGWRFPWLQSSIQ